MMVPFKAVLCPAAERMVSEFGLLQDFFWLNFPKSGTIIGGSAQGPLPPLIDCSGFVLGPANSVPGRFVTDLTFFDGSGYMYMRHQPLPPRASGSLLLMQRLISSLIVSLDIVFNLCLDICSPCTYLIQRLQHVGPKGHLGSQ